MIARFRLDHLENSHSRVFGRLAKLAAAPGAWGDAYVQADVATIAYTVYDRSGLAVTGHNNVSLVVADVISNSLIGWPIDDRGYNFFHVITPDAFPANAGRRVAVYTFTLSAALGNTVAKLIFDHRVFRELDPT